MALSAGSRLGPYEILSPLGAGGMGEVYRARDTRLEREVAIKVLPAEFASETERLKRFEKEARSASALNHPNIVTIYDIGSDGGVSYIAMERVDGTTLRELLIGGPMPIRKLLQVAPQIAEGLAKAHESGILHRDLKPENVMVTRDGHVKILDFGLAKLTAKSSGSGEGSQLPTMTATTPGVIMGTVSYMSPEQASGLPLDFRSDQFAMGAILYEMTAGKKAFQRKTAVDTLAAILNEEPEPLGVANPQAPAPLRWIVERCLSKEPEDRYAATRDLARDLGMLRDRSSEAAALVGSPAIRSRWATMIRIALGAIALAAASVFAGRLLWREGPIPPPTFQRLTFRRGFVHSARFSADGQTVVYSAFWDDLGSQVFLTRPESPVSQKLDIPEGRLLSLSSRGELAVDLGRQAMLFWFENPTLATVPIAGGAPRELAIGTKWADWAPDGKAMAVIRNAHLEFPMGKVIAEAKGAPGFPRFSPAGDLIAVFYDGRVHVVDRAGKERFASRKFGELVSMAWRPTGDEMWLAESFAPSGVVYALDLSGKERIPLRLPTAVEVQDISKDGRMLMTVGNRRLETWSRPDGQASERELTVLANSDAMGISPDGKTLLINDGGAFYLRTSDGSPPKPLGDGIASELSEDGKWVVVVRPGPPPHLALVPTGPGEERALENGLIEEYYWDDVRRSADGRRLVFRAREPGHADRFYVQDVSGGKPRPLTPEGQAGPGGLSTSISPDGRFVVVEQSDGFWIYPAEGGEKRPAPGLLPTDFVWRNWSDDGRFVYVWNGLELPFRVFRVEIATGRRELWKTIMPQDPAGIWSADLMLTPDGKSYAYNCKRTLSDLYLVEGLR